MGKPMALNQNAGFARRPPGRSSHSPTDKPVELCPAGYQKNSGEQDKNQPEKRIIFKNKYEVNLMPYSITQTLTYCNIGAIPIKAGIDSNYRGAKIILPALPGLTESHRYGRILYVRNRRPLPTSAFDSNISKFASVSKINTTEEQTEEK